MNGMLRNFWKKQVRRAGAVALPAGLGLALATLALARMQSANTLWHQELTVTGGVTTGSFGCQPYVVTLTSATVAGANTTYTYTFTGGGISGPDCKNDISYVALPVCFNPMLAPAGVVLSETHPAPTTNPTGYWTYNPDNGGTEKRVKWDGTGVGRGPFNATFSFTLAGTGIPMEAAQFQVHAGPKATTGAVQVPKPASCTAQAALQSGVSTADAGVATTSDTAAPAPQLAPAKATPTRTPTATPTPKGGKPNNSNGGLVPILNYPTPTPKKGN